MENSIITIENVKGYIGENNLIYLSLEDVARGLGFTQIKNGIDYVRWETVIKYCNEFSQQVGKDSFIPENIVYLLSMKADNETAIKFQMLLANEVIPSIRKNGMYATDVTIDKMLSDPDFAIELLTKLKEERAARVEAERTNAILMHVNKTYVTTEIAKELGMKSAVALNKLLEEKKVQYKVNGTWVTCAEYASCGYTDIKQKVLDNGKTIYDRQWTQLGRKFILELFGVKESKYENNC